MTSSLLHQVKARYNYYEYSSFYNPTAQNKFAFIEDPQIDLGLAQDRTYKVRKQKGRQISGPKGRIRDTQI